MNGLVHHYPAKMQRTDYEKNDYAIAPSLF